MFRTTYSDEENEFFKNCKGISYKEIQEKFKEKFGREITYSAVKHKMQRICGGSGIDARYKKGNKSYLLVNNHYSPKHRQEFEESIRHNSHGDTVFIKIDEKWLRKSRYIWEKHNGAIPDTHVIMLKDNNPLNCDIDNLMMVEKQVSMEFARRNYNELDNSLRETALTISKLTCDVRRIENEKKG